jgi:hypothetical protein
MVVTPISRHSLPNSIGTSLSFSSLSQSVLRISTEFLCDIVELAFGGFGLVRATFWLWLDWARFGPNLACFGFGSARVGLVFFEQVGPVGPDCGSRS